MISRLVSVQFWTDLTRRIVMKKLLGGLFALAMLVILGGCATGQLNGTSNDMMRMLIVYRTDDQELTLAQYVAVVERAKKMGTRIGLQLSSVLEAGLTAGFYSALSGSFDASGNSYGGVGIFGGVATYSWAKVYAVAESTENALRDDERDGMELVKRVHVTPAFVRSNNDERGPAK